MPPSSTHRLPVALRTAIKGVPIVLGLAGLILVIAWISGFFETRIPPGETDVTTRVTGDPPVYEVHEVTKEYIAEAVGTLKAASRSEISSRIMATILEIHVAAGDFVEQGQLLVTLDPQELDARLRQARESLAGAEAATREAETAFERSERLRAASAISQSEFDRANLAITVARADQRRAEQAVAEAEVYRSYARIEAPKAGRIIDRFAEPGDTAQPGKPILTLYDSQSLRLETPVLESLAVGLQVGQELEVEVDSLNRRFTAVVDEIVPQADAASRSFLVKASLPRSEDLYEGMYGRLQIPAGTRRHICLATDAIHRQGQLEFVDSVDADGVIQRRLIKTGRLGMPGRVEVLSGLLPGDRVLLNGNAASDESVDEPLPGPTGGEE